MSSMLSLLVGNIFKESGFEIERYAKLKHFSFDADFRTTPFENSYVIPPNKKYFLLYATMYAYGVGTNQSIADDAHAMMWSVTHQGKNLIDSEVIQGSSGDNVNRLLLLQSDASILYVQATATSNVFSLRSRVPIMQTVEGGQLKIRSETRFPGGGTINQWTYRGSVAALLLKNAY